MEAKNTEEDEAVMKKMVQIIIDLKLTNPSVPTNDILSTY